MPAQLYFSNSPAVLLDKLAENLAWDDPFASPNIATANPSMRRWVQMRLADKLGISANIDFMLLERLLWRRLAELDVEREAANRKPARLLDEQGLEGFILSLCLTHPPDEIRAYLDEGASDATAYAQRLGQLARKLAGYFREYEYSRVPEHGRKGLTQLWKEGEDCFRGFLDKKAGRIAHRQVEKLEKWQKAVYHAIFKTGGLRDTLGERTGQYAYTLPQFAEMVLAQKRPTPDRPDTPIYHLFGLSQISPFHRSLIRRLSDPEALPQRHSGFYIYSLNPCAVYWEDVLTPKARRKKIQEDLLQRQQFLGWRQLSGDEKDRIRLDLEALQKEELHLDADENPLLSRWGGPGRENTQLWSQLTGYDFHDYFVEPEAPTVLSTVQRAVLHRSGALPQSERLRQDSSLQILACPEIHREVETVHDSIIANLLENPGLNPEDIAIMVPDMDRYRNIIESVFTQRREGAPGYIPFTLNDTRAASESAYMQGLASLFALGGGKLTRREVFELIRNPCFQARHGLGRDSTRLWMRWADQLQIFRCFDGSHKSDNGYHPGSLHTWWHGLQRMLLGTVMEMPESDDNRNFEDIVPFVDGGSGQREELRRFIEVIQALHRDTARLRDEGPRPWSEWLALIDDVTECHLGLPAEAPLEAFVQAELRRLMLSLRNMDAIEAVLRETPPASGHSQGNLQPGVRPALVLNLLTSHLANLPVSRKPFLAGGVNIATLSSLRSLPFKITYILGLGEGLFPEDASTSTLDLRRFRRVIGDLDASARNRYWFLEALMSVREKLYLSYVDRDLLEDRRYQMSSTLNELTDYLEAAVLSPADAEAGPGKRAPFLPVTVPLLPHSPELYQKHSPSLLEKPRGYSQKDALLAWMWERKEERADTTFALPGEALRVWVNGKAQEAEIPTEITLDDLVAYLDNPVQYALERRLGLYGERGGDTLHAEDEPFFSNGLIQHEILETVYREGLSHWEDISLDRMQGAFRRAYEDLSRRGRTPEGDYQTLDRESLAQVAESAAEGLMAAAANIRAGSTGFTALRDLVFGSASHTPLAEEPILMPPLEAESRDGTKVSIRGSLPLLLLPDTTDAACATVVPMSGEVNPRRMLKPFLVYLLAQNSNHPLHESFQGRPFTVHFVESYKKSYRALWWRCFRVTPEAARDFFHTVLPPLLSGRDYDHLPLKLIFKTLAKSRPDKNCFHCGFSITEASSDWAESLRLALEDPWSNYTPPEAARLLGAKVPDDAETKIRSRFRLFFNGEVK